MIITLSPSSFTVGSASAPAYTVTPDGAGTATAGEPLDVTVKLTADPATAEYASAKAELTYNADYFTPDLAGLDVSEKTPGVPGTLLITAGPGTDTPVGENGAALVTIPFTPKAAGVGQTDATFAITAGSAQVFLQGSYGAEDAIAATPGAALTVTIEAAPSFLTGDANDDGTVEIIDAQIIFDYLTGSYFQDADAALLARMDVDGSGSVTAADYQKVVDIIHGR
jgi:hypothetical protein